MLFLSYAKAQHWGHLVRALLRSSIDSGSDELIELRHHFNRPVKDPPQGVQRVVFGTTTDIPRLLEEKTDSQSLSMQKAASTSVHPRVSVMDSLHANSDSRATESGPHAEVSLQNSEITQCTTTLTKHMDSSAVIENDHARTSVGSMDSEKAARTIQRAYKSYIARSALPLTIAQTHRQQTFSRYFEMSKKMGPLLTSSYRTFFLGCLPHLLFCLEGMRDYLDEEKKRFAMPTPQAERQELEEATSERSKIT